MTLEQRIQEELSDDLLTPEYRGYVRKYKLNRFAGHCYTASEAYYHLEGKKLGYKPCYTKVMTFCVDANPPLGAYCTILTHWYLKKDDLILDLTSEQFEGQPIPYDKGRRCGFLTKKPSMRARELMARVSE